MRLLLRGVLILGLLPAASGVAASDGPIRAGYERLYQGDPAGAYEHFRQLAGREPENLAAAYGALVALHNGELDQASLRQEFEQRAEQLIRKATLRREKDKGDSEALFYLAQAYGRRAVYAFDYGKGIWSAARDAVKAKNFTEDYLRLDPGRADAYFGLGKYNYYVDIAPAFVKFLRVFLFLPKGNRQEGLKQLERAAAEGELWAPEAQKELIRIYGSLEGRPEESLRLAAELHRRYPESPDMQALLAQVLGGPAVEDYAKAAEQYLLMVRRAEQGHPHYKGRVHYQALLGLARIRQLQWRLEEAAALLTPVIEAGPSAPDWVVPRFLLARGNYRALRGEPRADEDARRVLAENRWKRWHDSARRQLKWMDERAASGEASIYSALIPGNRLAAEERWDEAKQFYEGLLREHSGDWQVRYRLAYLEFARGDLEKAAAGFHQIVNGNPGGIPGWLKASSLLYLARVHDLRGQREQALKLYKRIVDDFEKEGAAGSARAGLLASYRKPARSGQGSGV